jgi:hypothetical protein
MQHLRGRGEVYTGFWCGNVRERDHSGEVNTKLVLQEVGCGCMDWIGLAQDRDKWQALVNAVTNLWAP